MSARARRRPGRDNGAESWPGGWAGPVGSPAAKARARTPATRFPPSPNPHYRQPREGASPERPRHELAGVAARGDPSSASQAAVQGGLGTIRAPSTAPRGTARAPQGAQAHYLGLPTAVRLGHLVGEVRLLKARGAHALVSGGVRARGRVWGVEARLDQRLPRLTGDHGLQLPCGKRVHMARLAGHQQQDLSARQRGELVGLPAAQGKNRESQTAGTRTVQDTRVPGMSLCSQHGPPFAHTSSSSLSPQRSCGFSNQLKIGCLQVEVPHAVFPSPAALP